MATSWAVFILGRVVAGLGVGMISSLCPLYQGETSPKKIRGLVVGLYQWAITIGILIAAIVNNSMQAVEQSDKGWRTVIGLQFAWAAILAGGLFFLPETPRYLAVKGRDEQSRDALHRLTNLEGVALDEEFAALKAGLEAEAAMGTATYREMFAGGENRMWFRTCTAIAIQAFQQLTGINFIFYFGTSFFKASGISDPFIVSVVTNVVNVVCTVPGLLIVDKVGRRPMLIWGAVGMSICEYIVAIVGVTKGHVAADGTTDMAAQRVLIAMVCIYIAFFAATWGPIAWYVLLALGPEMLTKQDCMLRSLPFSSPGQRHVFCRRIQLALEFWYRLRYPLPRQPFYTKDSHCASRCEGILPLGISMCRLCRLCLLLRCRDPIALS